MPTPLRPVPAPVRRWARPHRVRRQVAAGTRERNAALNQLLFGAVALTVGVLTILQDPRDRLGMFLAGLLLMFVVTAATLTLPWNRLARGWLAVVPCADIIAIFLLRTAQPDAALGLLWIFPAMWLSAGFGLTGLLVGAGGTSVAFFASSMLQLPSQPVNLPTYLLMPLVLIAVSFSTFGIARRAAVQRRLLRSQGRMLGRVLERTRRREQEMSEVLDAVDFGVVRIDASGATAVTNQAYGRLHRAIEDPAVPEVLAFAADGVTPLSPARLPLRRALDGEAFTDEVVWFGEMDGSDRRALSVTARRLRDPRGQEAGAVVVSRDVTAEIAALRARDDLVATVTHELRTPLTAVLGYLDLVADDPTVPDGARERIAIAQRNAERLLDLVGEILVDAQAARGSAEFRMSFDDVDVAAVLRASAQALTPRAAERSVTLDLSAVEPAVAWADEVRLRQVVDNLLSNAIKYNRDAGMVWLGSTVTDAEVWIVVRDSGAGMTEDEQADLFERFYRTRTARGSAMKGTGLGLAISRDIVRAHSGDITVRSTLGGGSTFMVRLRAGGTAPATGAGTP